MTNAALKKRMIYALAIIHLAWGFFFFSKSPMASGATNSTDTIAIRVMPNPKHFNPKRWYLEQGFSGSPQEMVVDGYDAIRDGNTVYVNAANIANGNFYTNIYAISYNLDADLATDDIFGQILQFWKFNYNLMQDSNAGRCISLSATSEFDTNSTCQNISDCTDNQYCTSVKASAIRDTRRLADLAELDIKLNNYRNQNFAKCPTISQGTYIPNHTVSTWPSWQATFGKSLGQVLPTDPINKLGPCATDVVNGSTYTAISETACTDTVGGSAYSCGNNTWTYDLIAPTDAIYDGIIISSNDNGGAGGIDISTYPIFRSSSCNSQQGFSHKIDIYIDSETSPRGFICNRATLPTNPQSGQVNIGYLKKGSHKIKFSWSNDDNFTGTPAMDSNIRIYRVGISAASSFDSVTCWDNQAKKFSNPIKPAPPYIMDLPLNSAAYSYISDKDGRKCAVNTILESTNPNLINSSCIDGGSSVCASNPVTSSNSAISQSGQLAIDCANIQTYPNTALSGFVKITPKNNTSITSVSISDMTPSWSTAIPVLTRYQNGGYWLIKSPAGQTAPSVAGNYSFNLNTVDSMGETTVKSCNIKVLNSYLVISPVGNITIMQGRVLDPIKVKAAVRTLSLAPVSFSFTVKDTVTNAILNTDHAVNSGFGAGPDIAMGWVAGSNYGSVDQKEYFRHFSPGEIIANPGANGSGRDYRVDIQAKDTAGNTAQTSFLVHVYNDPPTGTSRDITLIASTTKAIAEKIIDANDDQTNFPLAKTSLAGDIFSNASNIPNGLSDSDSSNLGIAPNAFYRYLFTGQLANSNIFNLTTQGYDLILKISDRFGVWKNFNFRVTINNQKPSIDLSSCPDTVLRYTNAADIPCLIRIHDADSNAVKAINVDDSAGLPIGTKSGLNVSEGQTVDFSFNTAANRSLTATPDHTVKFTAVDEFGLKGDQSSWKVRVNNYCGDGFVDNPNTEGLGGPANNGVEECDLGSGNSDLQNNSGYPVSACSTACTWTKFTNYVPPPAVNITSDSIAYDNNTDTATFNDVGGNYLKILGIQPTPYAYFADINNNSITKMKVLKQDGGYPRVCELTSSGVSLCYWDKRPAMAGTQPLGWKKEIILDPGLVNPSRTAVNVETGDFWVHSRSKQAVARFDFDGNMVMGPCLIDGASSVANGGGLAIDENGNAWAGSYQTGKIVLFNGTSTSCKRMKSVQPAGISGIYGLAINADGDLFVRGKNGELAKIKVSDGSDAVTLFSPGSGASSYGVTVDLDGNPWWGTVNGGVQTVDKNALNGTETTVIAGGGDYAVSIDSVGNIWGARTVGDGIDKYDPIGKTLLLSLASGSGNHGISGTSEGEIFSPFYSNSRTIFYYDNGVGGSTATQNLNDPQDHGGFIYTYADMAGLNRAMQFRSANWTKILDSGHQNQHWGNISYAAVTPAKTSVEFYIAASDIQADLPSNLMTKDAWNILPYNSTSRGGRYLMLRALLRSRQRGVTPVISDIKFIN